MGQKPAKPAPKAPPEDERLHERFNISATELLAYLQQTQTDVKQERATIQACALCCKLLDRPDPEKEAVLDEHQSGISEDSLPFLLKEARITKVRYGELPEVSFLLANLKGKHTTIIAFKLRKPACVTNCTTTGNDFRYGNVHTGLDRAAATFSSTMLATVFTNGKGDEPRKVIFTGHSLGGSLAILVALRAMAAYLAILAQDSPPPLVDDLGEGRGAPLLLSGEAPYFGIPAREKTELLDRKDDPQNSRMIAQLIAEGKRQPERFRALVFSAPAVVDAPYAFLIQNSRCQIQNIVVEADPVVSLASFLADQTHQHNVTIEELRQFWQEVWQCNNSDPASAHFVPRQTSVLLQRLLRGTEGEWHLVGEEKEQEKGISDERQERSSQTGQRVRQRGVKREPSFMMAGGLARLQGGTKGELLVSPVTAEDFPLDWLSLGGIEPEDLAQALSRHNWKAFDAILDQQSKEKKQKDEKKKTEKEKEGEAAKGKGSGEVWFRPDTGRVRLWISPDEAEVRLAGRSLAFISKVELLISDDESGKVQHRKGSTTETSVVLGATREQLFKCKIRLQGGYIKRDAVCWVEVTTVFPSIGPIRERVRHTVEYCSLEEARFSNLDPLHLLWAQLLRMQLIKAAHNPEKIPLPPNLRSIIKRGRWWKKRLVSLSRIDLYLLAGIPNCARPVADMRLLDSEKAKSRDAFEAEVAQSLLDELKTLLKPQKVILRETMPSSVRRRLNWFMEYATEKHDPPTAPEPLIFDVCPEGSGLKVGNMLASSLVDMHLCMPDFFQVSRSGLDTFLVRVPLFLGHVFLGTVVGLFASVALGLLSIVATPIVWMIKGGVSINNLVKGEGKVNEFAVSSQSSWGEEPFGAAIENDLFLMTNMCLAGVPMAALGAHGIVRSWYGKRKDDASDEPKKAGHLPSTERDIIPSYDNWTTSRLYVGLEEAGLTRSTDLGQVCKEYRSRVYLSKMQHLLEVCDAYPSDSLYWCERKIWEMFPERDWINVIEGDWPLHRALNVQGPSQAGSEEERSPLDDQRAELLKMFSILDGERSKLAYGNLIKSICLVHNLRQLKLNVFSLGFIGPGRMGKGYCLGKLFGHLDGIEINAGGRDADRTLEILCQPVAASPNFYLVDFPGTDEDSPLIRSSFKFAPVLLNFAVVVTNLKTVHTAGYDRIWSVLAEALKSGIPTLILLNRADEVAEEENLRSEAVQQLIQKQRRTVVDKLKALEVPATVQFLYKSLSTEEGKAADYSWKELRLEDIIHPSCLEMHSFDDDNEPIVQPQVKRFLKRLHVFSEIEIWEWICQYAQPWMAHLPPPRTEKD